MKKNTLLISVLLVGIGLMAGAYFWAIGMMDSIFAYRSPLKDHPPAPAVLETAALSERVIIVLIDGLRLDTSLKKDVMPTLDQLRSQGASSVMRSQAPSYSEPGYSTIITGAWPEINDGPVFNLDYEDIPTITQETMFSTLHRSGLKTGISAYYWFEKLIDQNDVDLSFYTSGDDREADAEVMQAAMRMLDPGEANLIFIHLDQVDYAGHHEGGVNENWEAAAARCDHYLQQIIQQADLSKDTLLVFSDHGHVNQGGHGGTEQVVTTEPFVMAGAGVIPGQYDSMNMVDIAPTVAFLLGSDLPSSTQGRVLLEMLAIKAEDRSALEAAVSRQQTNLIQDYAKAIGVEVNSDELNSANHVSDFQDLMKELRSARLSRERLPRLVITGMYIAALISLAAIFWRKELFLSILGTFLYMIIFTLVYLFGFAKTLSFSTVSGPMGLILSTAAVCAIALIPVWLLYMILTKQGKPSAVPASISTIMLIAVLIGVLLIPVMLHFGVNGLVLNWTMPQWDLLFLALLCLVQILVTVMLGLLLVGVSALIRDRNKTRP